AIMFGHAIANISNQILHTDIGHSSLTVVAISLFAIILSWVLLVRGPVSVQCLNRIVVPGLCIVALGMLALVFTRVSWTELVSQPPIQTDIDDHTAFMLAIELNIAGGLAWWPNVGNLARLGRNVRATFW